MYLVHRNLKCIFQYHSLKYGAHVWSWDEQIGSDVQRKILMIEKLFNLPKSTPLSITSITHCVRTLKILPLNIHLVPNDRYPSLIAREAIKKIYFGTGVLMN